MARIVPGEAATRPTEGLAQRLARQGWQRGVPPHLNAWARAVDEALCRRARCGNCQRRGLKYGPFFRGPKYRVVGECPDCGYQEEF
jgi:hypothetical protein